MRSWIIGALLITLTVACGDPGTMPPSALDEQKSCASLSDQMPITLGLLQGAGLPGLRGALSEELDEGSRRTGLRLVFGLLRALPPSRFHELEPLLEVQILSQLSAAAADLLAAAIALSSEVRQPMLSGLHTLSQLCPAGPPLQLFERLLAQPAETRAVMAQLLEGLELLVDPSELSAGAWHDLLRPVLEIAEVVIERPEDVGELLTLLAGAAGVDSEPVLPLVEDEEVMALVAESAACVLAVEGGQEDAVLWGLAHMLATQSVTMSQLTVLLLPGGEGQGSADEEVEVQAVALMGTMLAGFSQDNDARESLTLALAWLLEPARAVRVFPDVETLLRAGALEELLAVAVRLGLHSCTLDESTS